MRGHISCDLSLCCIAISLIVFGEIFWYINVNQKPAETKEVILPKLKPPEHLIYKCCNPLNITMKKNIFFIKTHKTGSSTVQNILLRFAKKYSLDVMWPIYQMYRFPISTMTLWPETITLNNRYHVLAFHTRFTPRLKSFQYPGTMMTTIVRHPARLFQSAYDYFAWEETTGLSFEEFLKAPIKPFLTTPDILFIHRGYNQMSVDLGFDLQQASNETAIKEFVKMIDEEFDFVMITEYMEASLVLLANLMGWPLEHVKYISQNVRPHDPNEYVQTEQDKLQLMELNKADAFLYNHFLQKFRKCVRQYGEHRMNQQILRLREINDQFMKRCVASESSYELPGGGLNFIYYEPKNTSDVECVDATMHQYTLELNMRYSAAPHLLKSRIQNFMNGSDVPQQSNSNI